MKKILTLLLACTLFAACDKNNDDPEPEKPYFNPVEGMWSDYDYSWTGARESTFVFTSNYEFYVQNISDGKVTSTTEPFKYSVRNDALITSKGAIYKYNIVQDTIMYLWNNGNTFHLIKGTKNYIK